MRSRKVRYGEQKLLELIDKEMQSMSNFDYSLIKEKIIIDEKGIKKVETSKNYIGLKLKYAISMVILIIAIIAFCTMCTLKNNVIFKHYYYLSEALSDDLNNILDHKINKGYYENTGLLSIMNNHHKNSSYIELTISNESDGKYYCVYLKKEIIDKVNTYFNENNLYDSYKYKELYYNNLFIGIDKMLIKTYLYFNNLNNKEIIKYLKWIEYKDSNKIKYEVGNYQLIYIASKNKVENVLDISTNDSYEKSITVYNEREIKIDNNIVYIIDENYKEVKRYLYKVGNTNKNNVNISMEFLEKFCAEIVDINYLTSVYINVPKWYEIYKDKVDNLQNVELVEYIINIDKCTTNFKEYKHYEVILYNSSDNLYYIRYYYNYNDIKTYLLS